VHNGVCKLDNVIDVRRERGGIWKPIILVNTQVGMDTMFCESGKVKKNSRWRWWLGEIMMWKEGCCAPCVVSHVIQRDKDIMFGVGVCVFKPTKKHI
jgi:hypothetical protein